MKMCRVIFVLLLWLVLHSSSYSQKNVKGFRISPSDTLMFGTLTDEGNRIITLKLQNISNRDVKLINRGIKGTGSDFFKIIRPENFKLESELLFKGDRAEDSLVIGCTAPKGKTGRFLVKLNLHILPISGNVRPDSLEIYLAVNFTENVNSVSFISLKSNDVIGSIGDTVVKYIIVDSLNLRENAPSLRFSVNYNKTIAYPIPDAFPNLVQNGLRNIPFNFSPIQMRTISQGDTIAELTMMLLWGDSPSSKFDFDNIRLLDISGDDLAFRSSWQGSEIVVDDIYYENGSPLLLGEKEFDNTPKIEVSPSITNDTELVLNYFGNANLNIFDIYGKEVGFFDFRLPFLQVYSQVELILRRSLFPSKGIYMIRLASGDKVTVKPVMVE